MHYFCRTCNTLHTSEQGAYHILNNRGHSIIEVTETEYRRERIRPGYIHMM